MAIETGTSSTIIQVVAPSELSTDSLQDLLTSNNFSAETERKAYFLNPLFRDTFGVKPGPEDIQEIDIFDKVELVDFFPSFENGVFKDLALENCKLTYFPKQVALMEPGLYFRTDLVLGGLLQGPLDFFKMFMSDKSDITIRLSAFLGLSLSPEKSIRKDKIVLSGCFGGLKACYPPGLVLLEVVTAGVRITIDNKKKPAQQEKPGGEKDKATTPSSSAPQQRTSDDPPREKATLQSTPSPETPLTLESLDPNKLIDIGSRAFQRSSGPVTTGTNPQTDTTHQSGNSSFKAEIFGNLLFHIPIGTILPLRLEYTAAYTPENIHFRMVLARKKTWEDAFGVENFHLNDVVIDANIPTKEASKAFSDKADKAALDEGWACEVNGSWAMGSKVLLLKGAIYSASQTQKTSYLEAALVSPTFDDIAAAAKKLHGYELEQPKQNIEFVTLRLRITGNGQFSFVGLIKIDGGTFEASLVVSKSGVFISGTAKEFKIPDSPLVIKEAKLDIVISLRSRDDKEPTPGNTDTVAGPGNEQTGQIDMSAGTTSMDEAKRNDALSAVPGKQAATNTDSTAPPARAPPMPKDQKSWFVGIKVLGVLVVPCGPKESDLPDAEYKFKFNVTFSMGYSATKGVEILVAGKARSTVSLRELCGDVIEEGSLLDAQLSDLTILGTNADNPYVPPEVSRFPIKKGFFVCATLDRVPLLEDKDGGGKALRKTNATDRAYMRIGYQKGDKIPKITIFLPPSFKVEFGDRFYTGGIFLELDSAKDPIASFYGELYMRMEDGKPPTKFVLEIAADALRGSLALKMDSPEGLRGPLGLSDDFIIYSLQGSVAVTWAPFLASGVLDSFGLGAKFQIEKDDYNVQLRLGTNPVDTLINIQGPKELRIKQLTNFVAALMNTRLSVPAADVMSLHELDVYVSKGCTWIDTYYPSGTRFRGMIKLWDFEASMDAEVNTLGLHLSTKIKGFQLGPLKVKGALEGEEDASLEVTLNPIKQSFFLTGRIEIFDIYCTCYVDCQFMPEPKFVFDSELVWSEGIIVRVHAQMVTPSKQSDGKELISGKELETHPSENDWEIYVLMEQSVIAQVKASILAAINTVHKAMEKGIGAAQKAVLEAQEDYDRECRKAEEKLAAEYNKRQDEIDRLERDIQEAKDELKSRKATHEQQMSERKAGRSSALAQGEKERAERLEPKIAARRQADSAKESKKNEQDLELLNASRKRDEKRDAFFSRFGKADAALADALRNLELAQREVDRLKDYRDKKGREMRENPWMVHLGVVILHANNAWLVGSAGLLVAEKFVQNARQVVNSDVFKELQDAMVAAEDYLATLTDQFASALALAAEIADGAFQVLEKAIRDEDFAFAKLQERLDAVVADVQLSWNNYEAEAMVRQRILQGQREVVLAEVNQAGIVALRKAVEFARNNNIALNAAKNALDAFAELEKVAYIAITEFTSAALDAMVDIQRVELKGVIRADTHQQQAFELTIKGQLGGKEFLLEEHWMPNKTDIFLSKVGLRAVAAITGANMDKEIEALDDKMKQK